MKMKVLLYLKKSGLDKSGKARLWDVSHLEGMSPSSVVNSPAILICGIHERVGWTERVVRRWKWMAGWRTCCCPSCHPISLCLQEVAHLTHPMWRNCFKAVCRHGACSSNDWIFSSGRRKNMLELTLREKRFPITILPVIIFVHLSKTSIRWKICLSRNLQKISFMISGTTTWTNYDFRKVVSMQLHPK